MFSHSPGEDWGQVRLYPNSVGVGSGNAQGLEKRETCGTPSDIGVRLEPPVGCHRGEVGHRLLEDALKQT